MSTTVTATTDDPDEALLHAFDGGHHVRVLLAVRAGAIEIKGDWRHRNTNDATWHEATGAVLGRYLIAPACTRAGRRA
jgi:hypothetical protein